MGVLEERLKATMVPHGVRWKQLHVGNNAPVIIVKYISGDDEEDAENDDEDVGIW